MPGYIVKVEPDVDYYTLWSTVTDCPHVWGTRAELEADDFYKADTWSAERFARADATGTSSLDGFFDWDDDDEFIVYNMGSTPGTLKRTDLRKFLESIHGPTGAECDESLLTPLEDDQEADNE